ncbi:8-oxo-dGTP pyrophosphatase MutT (NUDIX family) [Anoxybacillus tengchongensis]|uniref:8-oxo-dGTP pyrophosphatase MutT (NUDIX family) n=1 Tax=Anoxybacillus tengchongensis TaxID=576944 RepID=A0A7W9YQC9_9BACL|nr:CoA pyrophosphatase [Anoxybacillus tengchongensis]MBB6176280.1 8-oxo-dGTP pyrophosphatase MutT (NUDIX family) [Anoxybacillus tengchongensis]
MNKMIATLINELQRRTPTIMDYDKFAQYAVLLPLIQQDDEVFVLFEVRSLQLRRQPGEICFPGGKMDSCDQSPRETAIRETCEELGIEKEHITHIVPLDYIFSPFGMVIYPFVGFANITCMQINEKEVNDVFTVPLSFFLETKPKIYRVSFEPKPEEDFPFDDIPGGREYNWHPRHMEEHFYYYKDKVIWGLTAKIVYHFTQLIQKGKGE